MTYSPGLFVLVCFQEHLIENEVAVLRKVKHPNIIMLIEEVDTSSELCLVMELVKVQQRLIGGNINVHCSFLHNSSSI